MSEHASPAPPHAPLHMLIVEDDPAVRTAMEGYFLEQSWTVTVASDGEQALDLLRKQPLFDIVLLDVTLPKKNGFEVLRESQRIGLTAPVMMVTARGEQENVLKGFGLGAQDYVVKPFDVDDLMRRIEAVVGRSGAPLPGAVDRYAFGDVHINFLTGEAVRGERRLNLSELDLDLLRYLIQHQGQVVTRKRLLRDAWGMDEDALSFTISPDVAAAQLEKHVDAIRMQIEPNPRSPAHLETVFGLGYRFNA